MPPVKKFYWRLLPIAALGIAAVIGYHRLDLGKALDPQRIMMLRVQVLGLGPWGGVALFGAYVACLSLGLPNLPFQLAAGTIYGIRLGFPLMYLGVNLGALGAFGVARLLGRAPLERLWGWRLSRLNARIARGGFRVLLILRLIPLMPFNAVNFAAGLSRMGVAKFMGANAIGVAPLTLLHVALGSAAGFLDLRDPRSWLHPRFVLPLAGALILFVAALYTKRAKDDTGKR